MPKYKQKVVINNLEVILTKGGKHLKEQKKQRWRTGINTSQ